MQIFVQCIVIDLCFRLFTKSSFVAYFLINANVLNHVSLWLIIFEKETIIKEILRASDKASKLMSILFAQFLERENL